MTDTKIVVFTSDNGVARITLNRGPANAYTLEFLKEIHAALKLAEACPKSNAVILESGIEKFFCAGADIKAFQQNSTEENQLMVDQARSNLALIENSSKIYIAAIAGHCLGGGLEMVLACDFRFAADKKFLTGLPEIKLGLIPGNGGSQRLTKLVGVTHALEMLATGDPIQPQRALEIGLFNKLIPVEELNAYCEALAVQLSNSPGLALAATKRAVYEGAPLTLPEALELEQELVEALYETEDAKEGMLAFVEKRDPIFKGK